ncbi:polysaccharide pyruvyl transferase family protein [Litorilituus lipolyticus]|uniref:Polysaccharide pyruvyl transferase family protein n=1 Tax=Litorilituus lipolyticus TaxID=2491017 RepID=A0A502LGE4_9GAMM|nr:polysaccharide pyruvyl transferase family protein [Litorilituus lipolyticus]TPH18977.1 polysaccharide pyruvyl transferase family protein [Litorilituus lipolyticus]
MLNIEIKGVQFSNKGAELMLVAIIEQLDNELGDYQITLSPGRFLPYEKRAKLGAWQKLSFRRGSIDLTGLISKLPSKILNFFKRYGLVTEKNVDVILDASGFAYGEQWGDKSLLFTANEVIRCKKINKPYIFLPQAFGPFNQTRIREAARKIFSNASLTFPRDEHSYIAVMGTVGQNELGTIQLMPDFTCLVEPKPFEKYQNQYTEAESKSICLIPNNKMVSKFHHTDAEQDTESYLNFLVTVGKYYQEQGWQVVLLNHEGKEDQAICQQIQEQLIEGRHLNSVDIVEGLSAVDIKAFIGSVDAVVSSRFHGCVSALIQGVPCLATSWSHKYQMLFNEYGLLENVLDFKLKDHEIIEVLSAFNKELDKQSQQSISHAEVVKRQTRNMWKQVFAMLEPINKG